MFKKSGKKAYELNQSSVSLVLETIARRTSWLFLSSFLNTHFKTFPLESDMKKIDGLNKGRRRGPNPDEVYPTI